MQHQFHRHRGQQQQRSPTTPTANANTNRGGSSSATSPEAYNSFIDIDGFPHPSGVSSFASSPSHSTATTSTSINIDRNVHKLDPSSAVGNNNFNWGMNVNAHHEEDDGNDGPIISLPRNSDGDVVSAMDWPVENDVEPILADLDSPREHTNTLVNSYNNMNMNMNMNMHRSQQQQQPKLHEMNQQQSSSTQSSISRHHNIQSTASSAAAAGGGGGGGRDQQIFRRKNNPGSFMKTTTSILYSSSRESASASASGECSPLAVETEQKQSRSATTTTATATTATATTATTTLNNNGRGNIIFESYEQTQQQQEHPQQTQQHTINDGNGNSRTPSNDINNAGGGQYSYNRKRSPSTTTSGSGVKTTIMGSSSNKKSTSIFLDNIMARAVPADGSTVVPHSSIIGIGIGSRNNDSQQTIQDHAQNPSSGSNGASNSSRGGGGGGGGGGSVSKKAQQQQPSSQAQPQPQPPMQTETSGSISPQSMIRKNGVVNKLVSLFGNKQGNSIISSSNSGSNNTQQQNGRQDGGKKKASPRLSKVGGFSNNNNNSAPTTNSGGGGLTRQIKNTISSTVQFHVPKQSSSSSSSSSTLPQQGNNHQIGNANLQVNTALSPSPPKKSSPSSSSPSSTLQQTTTNTIIPPAISPTRSNVQSNTGASVELFSLYSNDDSSYNPTGWPGTVDKRGKTYMMEPSYSESEGESLSSPQRRSSSKMMMTMSMMTHDDDHHQTTNGFPVQSYRQNDDDTVDNDVVVDTSKWFPAIMGEDSIVASSATITGPIDLDSCYTTNENQSQFSNGVRRGAAVVSEEQQTMVITKATTSTSSSGPIDLDEAYEWRMKREGGSKLPLPNISETKTAADFQLEAALAGMTIQHHRHHQTPSKSMPERQQQRTVYTTPSPNSTRTNNNMLDKEEGELLEGIDLSRSAERVRVFRTSGERRKSSLLPTSSKMEYNEEVDFDNTDYHSNDSNNNNNNPQHSLHTTLSEEALKWNERHSAPPRSGASMNFRGYCGFLDKTKDVPNLMDDLESEASTSLGSRMHSSGGGGTMGLALVNGGRSNGMMGPHRRRPSSVISSSNVDSGSDVFDGIIQEEPNFGPMEKDILNVNAAAAADDDDMVSHQQKPFKQQTFENFDGGNLPYSTHFNPFASNSNRAGAPHTSTRSVKPSQSQQFDQQFGNAFFNDPDISAIEEIDDNYDDDESLPDLSIYYVQPEMVRKMVRAFRKLCTSQMEISSTEDTMLSDFETLVDTKKAFALFEMRSRIMETDIDRGLERRGGTNVEDDIVLTSYFQAAARVRDAVIVSKAWRDGATPQDVSTAHFLTRRSARSHFVRRPIQRIRRMGTSHYKHGPQYWLEEVKWLDDTDFMLMKCQSLGAGTMKGFEMFTIGDCQSILLRLTSDNCTQLRRELRSAMMRQIEAEELMTDEIDLDGDENIVAEAEQLYRDATIEVKTLSIKLVLADKAFELVRNRMVKLVETIESLLVSIQNDDESDDDTSSSTRSDEVDGSDTESYSSHESEDRDKLARRAKQAELSAEVAVREALLAKQEAEKISADKQREINSLKEKLADMETKSQVLASENRLAYMNGGNASYLDKLEAKSFLESTFDRDREEGNQRKDRLKAKFRERTQTTPKQPVQQSQLKDEEMYQHLDFYSRSLISVAANKS